jgi:hypothetical protein
MVCFIVYAKDLNFSPILDIMFKWNIKKYKTQRLNQGLIYKPTSLVFYEAI